MSSEQILRISRDDNEGGYVLVNVTSGGPSALDLKLLATEGESPYYLNIKQSRVQKFCAKASQLKEAEWEALLQSFLLRKPLGGHLPAADGLKKLEATASIYDDKLVIIFRNNISGITQRLGEISLKKDEDQEIDSISWAATAVTRSTDLEVEVKDLRGKYEEQGRMMERLNQQLESLIQAKIEHENSLLEKFRELLNAKKSKIRDLHRALAGVKVDPQNVVQSQSAEEILSPRSPAASRSTKRKAKGTRPTATASISTSDEEESIDKMSVDEHHEEAQVFTPERSDHSATEDEDDDDLDSAPLVSQPTKKEPVAPSDGVKASANAPARRPTPPPRRELPFAAPPPQSAVDEDEKKTEPAPSASQASNNTSATAHGDDDDDETSDDEL